MPKSVPSAKLSPPRLANVLIRKKPFACIDRACDGGALWVTGPPGAGKSVLLSSYCQEHERPVLWYKFDETDNDPATFFFHLSLAVERTDYPAADGLPALYGDCLDAVIPFAHDYFRQLFGGLAERQMLVFDDCHVLADDSELMSILSQALEVLPCGQGMALLSRRKPANALLPQLLNGNLHCLQWHDLRLDMAEMQALCRQRLGGSEWSGELQAICEASHGWAAGLVLMLEHYRDGGYCPTSPLDDIQNHQQLFGYFAREVIDRLPADRRGFLMRAALLPAMTGAMARELTQHDGAERILDELADGGFFTYRTGSEPMEYEFHPLFRSFLCECLKSCIKTDALRTLQCQAAAILASHRHPDAAAELYGQAGEWNRLAELCEERAPHLLDIGCNRSLLHHLERIPDTVLNDKPWLLLYYGAAARSRDLAFSRDLHVRSYRRFRREGEANGAVLAWSGIVESYIYQWGNFAELDDWIDEFESLTRKCPTDELPLATRCRMSMAIFTALMYRQPWHPQLPVWADRIEAVIVKGRDPRLNMKIGMHLLMYHAWWSGDLPKSNWLVSTLQGQATRATLDPFTRIAWHAIEAAHAWMVGRQARALQSMEAGLAIARRNRLHHFDFMLSAQGAWAHITREDLPAAERLLDSMQAMLQPTRTLDHCHYHYLRSMAVFQTGNGALMLEYATKARDYARQAGCPWAEAIMETGIGRALHLLGENERGREHQLRALAMGRHHNSGITERGALLALAELELETGDEEVGKQYLGQAFAWCRRHGAVNWAAWRSETSAWLCGRALQDGIETEYARLLVHDRNLKPVAEFRYLQDWPWPVRIYTLGRFAVVIDGEMLAFRNKTQKRPLELLKMLIALCGRDVSQGTLADRLWPDAEGDAARRTFDSTLHRLRKILSVDDLLILGDGKLSLNADLCWVDAWAFEHQAGTLFDRTRGGALNQKDIPAAITALNLYQGRFLQNENLLGIEARMQRYEEHYVRLCLAIGSHYGVQGDSDMAIANYTRALEIVPADERLYQALIQLLLDQERHNEALRWYRHCEVMLARETGLKPGKRLKSLVEPLLST